MQKIAIIGLGLILSGCASEKPASHQVADSAKESIQTIVANKPECKDVGKVCESQIDSIIASCDLGFEKLTQEKIKWKWAFIGLAMVIGVYVSKKILK